MDFALVYLANRFFFRIVDFFHHWYVDASKRFAYGFISFLEYLDRTFAVKITLKYFFHPLYKDYSVIGRVLGVFFRSGRIVFGSVVYLFWTVLFGLAYILWLIVPAIIIFYVFRNL